MRLAILSDIHYASAAEKARGAYFMDGVKGTLRRKALWLYRHYYWQRDPFAHNHLLDQFISQVDDVDLVIALGDFSCDSAFVGLDDDAAFASAAECLGKLRTKYQERLTTVMGDHELGKKPLGADQGGLRLRSMARAQKELGMAPFWQKTVGCYVLMGIMSSLVAWPVFRTEALPAELPEWEQLRASHLQAIRQAFADLQPHQRVLLFCHDPTALPFLWQEQVVREKLAQVERTIIGHLHSSWILFKSRILSGMPTISFLGHTVRRLSTALRQAHYWKPFHIMLCPSLAGMELWKDGGYYIVELYPNSERPAEFHWHRLKWRGND